MQPFMGNLVQDKALRQKGVTGLVEFNLGEFARAGGSYLVSKSDFLKNQIVAGQTKIGLGKGHSVLAELGEVQKTPVNTGKVDRHLYAFTQGQFRARRGLWGIMTIEMLEANKLTSAYVYRLGPGVQYFPMQRLELRADAYNTYRITEDESAPSTWDLTAQVHLWL